MRSLAILAFAFLLSAVPSRGQTWTETGRALPGALGGPYRMTVSFEFASFRDLDGSVRGRDDPVADEEGIVPSFRYYLTSVDDTEKPYHLQPFLQRASYLEGCLESGPGEASLLAVNGRFLLPGRPVAVTGELAFGDALLARDTDDGLIVDEGSQFRIGGGAVYYLTDENNLALEGSIAFEWTEGRVTDRFGGPPPSDQPVDWEVDRTILLLGARYVAPIPQWGGLLEVRGGFRMIRYDFKSSPSAADWKPVGIDEDLMGLVVDARYFFDKHFFAGLKLTTDTDLFGITVGYAMDKGFQAEMEFGDEEEFAGPFFRLKLGMRF